MVRDSALSQLISRKTAPRFCSAVYPKSDIFHPKHLSDFQHKNRRRTTHQAVLRRLPMVGVTGFEPAASCSQSRRATNCATPRFVFCVSLLRLNKILWGPQGPQNISYYTTRRQIVNRLFLCLGTETQPGKGSAAKALQKEPKRPERSPPHSQPFDFSPKPL